MDARTAESKHIAGKEERIFSKIYVVRFFLTEEWSYAWSISIIPFDWPNVKGIPVKEDPARANQDLSPMLALRNFSELEVCRVCTDFCSYFHILSYNMTE